MHRLSHLTIVLACAVVGCAQRDIVPGVSDSTFVAAMADLRRLEDTPPDTAARAAARRRILQQRGLTVEQMDRVGSKLAKDPKRAAAIFDAIQKRAVNAVQTTPAQPQPANPAAP
jgi:hypothetical protein